MSTINQNSRLKIALYLPSLRGGGVERVFVLLAKGLSDLDQQVDLVAARLEGKYAGQVDPRVNLIDLDSSGILASFPRLINYLNKNHPDILISAMPHANCAAVTASKLVVSPPKTLLTEHNTISNVLSTKKNIKENLVVILSKWLYPKANAISAVSQGVAKDSSEVLKIPRNRINQIYNPIDFDEIVNKAIIPVGHKWIYPNQIPVILAVGRLTYQKSFDTLIRAFSVLRKEQEIKLVILGEGPERENLRLLIAALNLSEDVDLPGFTSNPFQFMKRCNVFVVPSRYEGFGLVIAEALACGASIVSTDCPSGPSEILENGRYGKLVPVEDPESMAKAIQEMLDKPIDAIITQERARSFSLEKISKQYLSLIREIIER